MSIRVPAGGPRISARRREFIAKGLRIVPEDPGPEFPRIPHACSVAPARCGECTRANTPNCLLTTQDGVDDP